MGSGAETILRYGFSFHGQMTAGKFSNIAGKLFLAIIINVFHVNTRYDSNNVCWGGLE